LPQQKRKREKRACLGLYAYNVAFIQIKRSLANANLHPEAGNLLDFAF
jgi:hypothetical protein